MFKLLDSTASVVGICMYLTISKFKQVLRSRKGLDYNTGNGAPFYVSKCLRICQESENHHGSRFQTWHLQTKWYPLLEVTTGSTRHWYSAISCVLKRTIIRIFTNKTRNRRASFRLTQWPKVIPHTIKTCCCCCCINEPVMFGHGVHLKLGHRFHACLVESLLWSWRYCPFNVYFRWCITFFVHKIMPFWLLKLYCRT